MPLGTEKALLQGSGAADENYFGDESDGAVTISSDTALTVDNQVGYYDGDMVVKNYTSLTIDATKTLNTDYGCRGLLIYCTGNIDVSGYLSMHRRGAYVDPESSGGSDSAAVNEDGLQLPMYTASGSDTLAAATFAGTGNAAVAAVANQPGVSGDGSVFSVVRKGAGPCAGVSGTGPTCAASTTTATSGQSGMGGGGAGDSGTGGDGEYGSCFAGGSAGAGGAGGTGGSATIWSGPGGGGTSGCSNNACGGSGNPAGGPNGQCGDSGYVRPGVYDGTTGTAGTIWIVCGGDVTINSGGSISSSGIGGGDIHTYYSGCCSGITGGNKAASGGSGGGVVMILHAGTYTNNGSVSAGGATGCGPSNLSPRVYSGTAGAGSVVVAQVS